MKLTASLLAYLNSLQWNAPHLRLGRRSREARAGALYLFRLQNSWYFIQLPPADRASTARTCATASTRLVATEAENDLASLCIRASLGRS